MGETSAERAGRILRDWAGVVPRQDEGASVQQRIVGDVTGLAGDVLALRAEVERLRGLVGEPDRNPAPHTPLRAFVGILPEAGR